MLKFIRRTLSSIFSVIGFIVVVAAVIGYFKLVHTSHVDPESDAIASASVLQIEVGGLPMTDFNLPTSLVSQLQKYRTQSLIELIDLINDAKGDSRIKAISLIITGNSFSAAQAEELRRALEQFRKADKKVYTFAYAFGDGSNGTSAYYLASVSDKIYMQPHSPVSIIGASLEAFFLRDLLDKLQVNIQFARRNAHKGVVDRYARNNFTPEVKANLSDVLTSIITHVQEKTAASRGIDLPTYINLVNTAPHHDRQALEHKLLDSLIYRDEIKGKIKADLGQNLAFVTDKAYSPQSKRPPAPNKIGVIFLDAEVVPAGASTVNINDPYSPESLDKAFEVAIKDKDVKAIIFRINTPGGAVSGAEVIHHAVKRTIDKGIPVIVSMGNVAASAGYYMAAPATKIYANGLTLTGSIGIAMMKPNIRKATENYGVTWDQIQVGNNAAMWSITQDFNEASWNYIQESLDRFYANFIHKVAEGRKLPPATVEALAGGQVWSGLQAKHNGLVDEIGGFFDALEEAKKICNVKDTEEANIVIFNRIHIGLPLLFSFFEGSSLEVLKEVLGIKDHFNQMTATHRLRLVM